MTGRLQIASDCNPLFPGFLCINARHRWSAQRVSAGRCWQVLGQGQFRPLAGSDPFLGRQGEVEQVEEYRVEMVCERAVVGAAVAAMKQAHPYEEPAWDVVELVTELPEG
jgi:hypothetical protein